MKILLVEDQLYHQEAGRKFLEAAGHEVVLASTFSEATLELSTWQREGINGVITDIFFPQSDRKTAEQDRTDPNTPCGVGVAVICNREGIPFVLCTSTYHHGDKTQWIFEICDGGYYWPIVDVRPEDIENNPYTGEATEKNWAESLRLLEKQVNKN